MLSKQFRSIIETSFRSFTKYSEYDRKVLLADVAIPRAFNSFKSTSKNEKVTESEYINGVFHFSALPKSAEPLPEVPTSSLS